MDTNMNQDNNYQNAQPQGQFTQPQGQFAQPQGQFTQPQGQFTQPQGQFTQPQGQFAQPQGQFVQPQAQFAPNQNPAMNGQFAGIVQPNPGKPAKAKKVKAPKAPKQPKAPGDVKRFCESCGGDVDAATGMSIKKKGGAAFVVATIILAALLVATVGLNVFQYLSAEKQKEEIESLNTTLATTISEKDSAIASKDSEIAKKDKTIASQTSSISDLQSEVDELNQAVAAANDSAAKYESVIKRYDYIVSVLSLGGNLGYAASNFRVDKSAIVVKKSDVGKSFYLTANWTNGGTVSVSYAETSPAATISFDTNSWTEGTNMTIHPDHVGVTKITFTNNVDSKKFYMLIIVEE